ncbi:hypothetical protein QE152_g32654 [Popillia japonica]|uniref:Uncharacterized protein n=1 Tax=Popillia japonica TaxID=7064 RepID=A0AAW1IYA5_POPJA
MIYQIEEYGPDLGFRFSVSIFRFQFFRHRRPRCDGCFLALNPPRNVLLSRPSAGIAARAEAERQQKQQRQHRSPHEPTPPITVQPNDREILHFKASFTSRTHATHHSPTERPRDPPLQIDLGIDSSVDQVKRA